MTAIRTKGGYLHTGDAARLTGLSPKVIAKSFDNGLIRGHRLQFCRVRRFTPAALRAFMVAHDIPTTDLDAAFPPDA